jgi:enediyne biosynthesis protein E4
LKWRLTRGARALLAFLQSLNRRRPVFNASIFSAPLSFHCRLFAKPGALRLAAFFAFTAALLSGCKSKPAQQPAPSRTAQPVPTASSPIKVAQPASPRPSGPITFTDVTAQSGIHFKHNSGAFGAKYLPETMGSGVCVIDYDNDGWPDIFFVNSMDWPGHVKGKSYPALYHNNHDGTFTDVTLQAGLNVEMYGMGCAVGDFDNDGYDDIYVTAIGGSHLFRNLHNGKFADVTAKAGLADSGFPTGAVWFDYDNDGKLDLFVAHYVEWWLKTDQRCSLDGTHKSYCTPEVYKGESARLFHNLGNGRFEDVTKQAGLYDPKGKSLGVALLDYDNDGWIDLFVSNDTAANKLYHNNHNGTFSEAGFAAGVAFSDAGKARAGMGTDAGDYDGSGRQSLVIGNFTDESIALYHNDGSGLFSDQSVDSGIASPSAQSLTFGCFFFDYDLDGRLDIFAANGHVADDISVVRPNLHYAEPPLLFHNRGQGKFEDVSADVGAALRRPMVARGAAYADFDNDGDLDLVVTTNNGPAHLFRNDNGNRNDMLRLKLVGTRSNRDAIGAKVTLTAAGGVRQLAMVKSGSSYLSQSEFPLTFGLGKPGSVSEANLEIAWPSGRKQTLSHVAPDQFLVIEEGKGIVSARPIAFTTNSKP